MTHKFENQISTQKQDQQDLFKNVQNLNLNDVCLKREADASNPQQPLLAVNAPNKIVQEQPPATKCIEAQPGQEIYLTQRDNGKQLRVGEASGQEVSCTEQKREVLMKVRRGRNIIKTINPFKSAAKIDHPRSLLHANLDTNNCKSHQVLFAKPSIDESNKENALAGREHRSQTISANPSSNAGRAQKRSGIEERPNTCADRSKQEGIKHSVNLLQINNNNFVDDAETIKDEESDLHLLKQLEIDMSNIKKEVDSFLSQDQVNEYMVLESKGRAVGKSRQPKAQLGPEKDGSPNQNERILDLLMLNTQELKEKLKDPPVPEKEVFDWKRIKQ